MSPRSRQISHAIELVAADFNIEPWLLFDNVDVQLVNAIRHLAIVVARHSTGHAVEAIGKAMDRHHTTITYSLHKGRTAIVQHEWLQAKMTKLICRAIQDFELPTDQLVVVSNMPHVQSWQVSFPRYPRWVWITPDLPIAVPGELEDAA